MLKTLYVNRPLTNAADLVAWARSQGFSKPMLADDVHVTVAFSKAPVDWDSIPRDAPDRLAIDGGPRQVEKLGDKGAVVLRFESPDLRDRWKQFGDAGASWDWPEYKPHVTITYEGDTDLSAVEAYRGALEFGPERFAEVDESWADKVKAAMDAKTLAFDRLLPGLLMAGTAHALRARSGLALDRATVRSYDKDGRMRVAVTNISKAAVNPYVGHEIPEWRALDLQPDKIYKLFRDPAELAKAAPTFNNVPVLSEHVAVTADDHKPELVMGATGSDAEFVAPFLRNSLVLWARRGLDAVESDEQKELSCAYHYRADMTAGSHEGERYDGVMRDIVGNHVALVKEGRAGADVVVGDSMEMVLMAKSLKFSHTASVALGALAVFLAPKLALDAKLDIGPALAGITAKNFTEKKADILAALTKMTDGKLAKDASIDGLTELLDKLEAVKGDATEPNSALPIVGAGPEDDESMDAGPNAAAAEFLKSKLSAEDMKAYDDLCAKKPGMDADETDEEKKAREKKEAEEKTAKDAAEAAAKNLVTKPALDAAIKVATDKVLADQRALRDAEEAVRPYVGKLALAHDSAEAVYRTALGTLGVKAKGLDALPLTALQAILEVQPRADARKETRPLALDAAGGADFDKRFPGAARIQIAG